MDACHVLVDLGNMILMKHTNEKKNFYVLPWKGKKVKLNPLPESSFAALPVAQKKVLVNVSGLEFLKEVSHAR